MAGNPNLQANRQVCDVLIREYATGKPFLYLDTANATGIEISGDSVNANAKGRKRINFCNPFNNTITLEAQVFPLKLLAMLGDGSVKKDATYSKVYELTADATGITLPELDDGETVVTGSYYCYPTNSFGDDSTAVTVTAASNKLTASGSGTLNAGEKYKVAVMVTRTTGASRVELRDDVEALDLAIQMSTLNKNDAGAYIPTEIIVYKANLQRSVSLNLTSDGDPVTLSLTFDVMTDASGKNMDIVQH